MSRDATDPQEQHREALARLNGLLEDEFLIIAYEPFLRGCRDILLRHAPVECVDVVPESHWAGERAVPWRSRPRRPGEPRVTCWTYVAPDGGAWRVRFDARRWWLSGPADVPAGHKLETTVGDSLVSASLYIACVLGRAERPSAQPDDAEPPVFQGMVLASAAPLGVQLWPTTDDAVYGRNFTLAQVTRALGGGGEEVVCWTYDSGVTRLFTAGERVLVGVYQREDLAGVEVEWI